MDDMKVSEFIQQPGKWNFELIQQSFLVLDSQIISTIPLSTFNHTDSWLWHYNRNGSYLVKSGYTLAINENRAGDPSSSSEVISDWWKAFWAIEIPRKILIFAWKGYHEILPTTKGLYRRRISSHSNCPICEHGEDSNAHAIFWCSWSQKVWVSMDYPFFVGHKEEIPFKDVLVYATELLERDEIGMMLMISWGIWAERNKKTHGQQPRSPQQLKSWITSYYDEIKNVHRAEDGVHSVGRQPREDQGEVGTNDFALLVDASLSASSQRVGLGAVIITTDKRILARLSKPLEGTLSVIHAEALALLVGLQWAQTIGLTVKMILTDSLSLVQALNNNAEYQNELGIILADIRMVLLNFPGASITHVSRKYNVTAHNLAKQALQLVDEVSWMEDIIHQSEHNSQLRD